MKKIYLITNYAELDGVLDATKDKEKAIELYWQYLKQNQPELKIMIIKYDGRIYDYDRENYQINFFERIENNKWRATPYLDRSELQKRGIKKYYWVVEHENQLTYWEAKQPY